MNQFVVFAIRTNDKITWRVVRRIFIPMVYFGTLRQRATDGALSNANMLILHASCKDPIAIAIGLAYA